MGEGGKQLQNGQIKKANGSYFTSNPEAVAAANRVLLRLNSFRKARWLLGVGGAMDLALGAKRLIITMTHTTPSGESKLMPRCTLPLTAVHFENRL